MGQITCPSGLSGVIKDLSVAEAEVLVNRRVVRDGSVVDKILVNNWVSTIDPGIYDVDAKGNPFWGKVLAGDRFYAVMMIRIETYGPEYDFDYQCENCGDTVQWTIDLNDLDVRQFPQDSLHVVKDGGNRFSTVINDATVVYQLLTGDGEKAAQKMARRARLRNKRLAPAVVGRVVEVEKQKDVERWVDKLSMSNYLKLTDEMEDADGGVDTTISAQCTECEYIQEVDLPFNRLSFWLPTGKQRRRRRNR